jgi:hypothetical protein
VRPLFEAAAAQSTHPFYVLTDKAGPETLRRYGVRGFPTIWRFRAGDRGAPDEFVGERTAAGILAFAEQAH